MRQFDLLTNRLSNVCDGLSKNSDFFGREIQKITILWSLYFCIKVFYLLFGHLVFDSLSQLGDTAQFLNSNEQFSVEVFQQSTVFILFFSALSNDIFGSVLGSFPFLLLSFFGVVYAVERGYFDFKTKIIIVVILSFPSFGMWSSVASKEAIMVFSGGILLGTFFDLLGGKKISIILFMLAAYLFALFKPHYTPAIGSLLFFGYFYRFFVVRKKIYYLTLAVGYSFFIGILFSFSDQLDSVFQTIPIHFVGDSASVRQNTFWIEEYDFLRSAPKGMFLSLWGPTFADVIQSNMKFAYYFESLLLLGILVVSFVNLTAKIKAGTKMDFVLTFSVLTVIFLLIFANYPFGTLNAGSALRYRTNIYLFLVILIFLLNRQYFIPKNELPEAI